MPTSCGCRYAAAEDAAILALDYAQKAGEAQEEARIVDVLCTSLLYGPTPADEAVARCEEMLEHERESRVVEANIAVSLAGLLAMLGRFDEARAYAERAKSVYGELGQTMAVAGWTQIAGPMELLAADPAAAERHLRLGLDLLADAGAQEYQASLLAEALYQLGSYDEADSFAELALAQSGAGDDAARVIASGVRREGPGESPARAGRRGAGDGARRGRARGRHRRPQPVGRLARERRTRAAPRRPRRRGPRRSPGRGRGARPQGQRRGGGAGRRRRRAPGSVGNAAPAGLWSRRRSTFEEETMGNVKAHGKAHGDGHGKHSESFDRALEDALAQASASGFEPGTHNVRVESRAVMEVTNPGRIQSYIVSIEKDEEGGV